MDQVVPWKRLQALIEPHYPVAGCRGRQPYPPATMLRIHFLQQWYALSDPSMEEALYDTAVMRRFAGVNSLERIPEETTILNFRRLLEIHGLGAQILEAVSTHLQHQGLSLRAGTIVDATLIHAPSSTKNADKTRDAEMHQTRKGNQWYFGMKAHIGVDEFSGLVHHVTCTAANVGDVTVMHELLHGKDDCVLGDSGYTAADSRPELQASKAAFLIAKKRGQAKAIKNARDRRQHERWESCKASMRAKGGASLPGHQTPVWLHQGALSRASQEQRAGADAVCAVQSVDDAPAVRAGPGINPPEGAQRHLQNPVFAKICRSAKARTPLRSRLQRCGRSAQTIPNACDKWPMNSSDYRAGVPTTQRHRKTRGDSRLRPPQQKPETEEPSPLN